MKHLDLFSGIGGFALACEWAGIETIGFVEIDPFCQKVLKKHWPDVKIVGDIRDVTETTFAYAEQLRCGEQSAKGQRGNIQESPCSEIGTCGQSGRTTTATIKSIDLITGGFPCQPFSVAGKRQGDRDDRYLWPEMLRVIEVYKPTWVLGENVAGIVSMALDTVLSDMENAGYEVQAFVIPACAVNAWHRRDRVWIVAHARGRGFSQSRNGMQFPQRSEVICSSKTDRQTAQSTGDVALTTSSRQKNHSRSATHEIMDRTAITVRDSWKIGADNYWSIEPELGRVAHGIPHRVDRLKALGNAIVPQVAYQILKAICESSQIKGG